MYNANNNTKTKMNTSKEKFYNDYFAEIFSHKEVLAPVLKNVIPEYNELSIEEIISYIGMQRDDIPLTNKRFSEEGVGAVEFDILVECELPTNKKAYARVRVDVEMQNAFYTRYDLSKRTLYYACRMIDTQLPKIDVDVNYKDLVPVYTIWIVKNVPTVLENQCVTYGISRKSGVEYKKMDEGIDLLNITMIYLGKEINYSSSDLIKYLQSIMKNKIDDRQLNKYVDFSNDIKEVIAEMTRHDQEIIDMTERNIMEKVFYNMVDSKKSKKEIIDTMKYFPYETDVILQFVETMWENTEH